MPNFFQHYPSIEFKRAALYVRCSSEEQVKFGDTIEAQTEDLKAFAKEHNLQVVDIYTDEGHTARKKYTKRTEFMRMLHDAEQKKFEYIIFTKLDRWFRNISDFYKIQEILDANGVTWLTALERYEMETTNGKLNVNIRLSVAQDEADRISDRIKDVFRLKVNKSEVISGSVPLGYKIQDKHLVIDEETAPIALDIFENFELTGSKRETTAFIRSKYGISLFYQTVSRMLKQPLYKGVYKGNANYCPALIEPSRFDRLQKLAKKNVRKRSSNRSYVFTGLIRCKECGHKMCGTYCHNRYKEYRYYLCPRQNIHKLCTHTKRYNEETLEKYLLDTIKPQLREYITAYELEQKKKASKNDSSKIRNKLSRLKELYVNELIDLDEYKKTYDEYQTELKKVETSASPVRKDLSALKAFLNTDLEGLYHSLSVADKRNLWASIIDYMIIDNENNVTIYFL